MQKFVPEAGSGGWLRTLAGAAILAFVAACGDGAVEGEQPSAAATTSNSARLQTSQPSPSARQQTSSALVQAPAISSMDTSSWVLAPPFHAAGDEPFWRLEIADGWFVFKRSGLPEIEAPLVMPERSGASDVFNSPPLQIRVRAGTCTALGNDAGVANIVVDFDGIEFAGCGFAGENATGDTTVTSSIIESLGAVDACMARLGEPALVTGIYSREGDRTALGLRTRIGRLYECAVESGDGSIAFLDPIEPGAANAWMTSGMRFLRAGMEAQPLCDNAEEVRTPDGLLGWLLPASCRF